VAFACGALLVCSIGLRQHINVVVVFHYFRTALAFNQPNQLFSLLIFKTGTVAVTLLAIG
jgi:hypothetical protein